MRDDVRAQAATAPGHDAVWMLVDLLASIVGRAEHEVARHLAAMDARGSGDGQCQVVAQMCGCGHPRLVEALELLAAHHPDAAVAREARKSALLARTRALVPV